MATSTLSAFICNNLECILDAWEAFAHDIISSLPPSVAPVNARDHAKGMLLAIVADMKTPETPEEQFEKSMGHGQREVVENSADLHGAARESEGFSIDQEIAEFRALRATVLRLWNDSSPTALQSSVDELMRFNEAVDRVLAESVARYAAEKERSAQRLQNEVRHASMFSDTIIESAPGAFFVIDENAKLVRWNQFLRKETALSDEQLRDNSILAAIYEPDRPLAAAKFREAFATGYAHMELRVVTPDHGIRHFLTTARHFDVAGVPYAAGFCVDVTQRKRAERALKESERRLALALRASSTAVWEVDIATQRLHPCDDELFSMLGYARGQLHTVADWIGLIHEEDRPRITSIFEEIVQGRRDSYHGLELRYRKRDGSWLWMLCQAVATDPDAQGRMSRLIGTHTNIHARKQAEESAREASLHDPLTTLPNRALIFEYGSRLLAAAQRNHGRGALLFVDLDRFKPINDQYGHEVGDRVLQEVGQRLRACTREEDMVGRLGGDEFVIILGHLDGHAHRALAVAQHVVDRLSQPFAIDSIEVAISPSIGISLFPEHADDVERLIHTADLAMYQVKQTGRASYQVYTPELERRADKIYLLETRVRKALKHGRLILHYQPVVSAKTGELISVEALVRLADDPECDSAGPAAFIPIAESAGLIGDLGDWVATEACRQHEAWLRQGMSVTIAINVSPLQFRQRGFPERLGHIIAEAGIDPAALQLEVTETTVMESDDYARDILNRIKRLGVKVALDDFGTGYSSLSLLSRLPLDKLKVDQSFVCRVESDPASRAITEAIIALGHNLKLDIIGEGVETPDMLHYLEREGCDQVQGFQISKPLPATQFEQWYRERQMH